MKKLLMATALVMGGTLGTGAHAQVTMSDTFDVNINLTAACSLSPVGDVAFTYVSNQGVDQPSTGGGFTVTCTPGVAYTFEFEHPVGTGLGVGNPVTETDNVVLLQYTLSLPAPIAGTGVGQNYAIAGNMPQSQAGSCGAATCTNAAATNKTFALLVTY